MMAPVDVDNVFASYLREKRAVSTAKRFISRGMRFSPTSGKAVHRRHNWL